MSQDEGVTEGGAAPETMDTEKTGSLGGIGSPTMGGQGGSTGERTESAGESVAGETGDRGYSGMDAQTQAGSMGSQSSTDKAQEQSEGAVSDPYTMGRDMSEEGPESSALYAETGHVESEGQDLGDQAKKQFQEMGPINLTREDES
ncbi:MAG: hypothetical protein M3164_02620 [Actinomycetota bacterium]|nr:hypothetical protein [Actinomycetota bacterium]